MYFTLTEEQSMIQAMAHDFAREVILPTAAARDKSHEFPRENLLKMGELGFMGMMIPEEYGGAGADCVAYALALTEIAYACASTAVVMSVHNSICTESILHFGTEEQKRYWLPQMCRGECIGAFALTEPNAGSDPSSQKTTAVLEGDEWVINGTKQFITSGKNGGLVICTAVTDKSRRHRGISAFIIPQGTPGMSVGREEEKLGLKASDTVQLVFEDCRLPVDAVLGKPGEGFRVAMTGLDSGRIGIASQSVGVAQACMDEAVEFITVREQFGRPVSEFQGMRWKVADMVTQIEAARLMCLSAAARKARGERVTQQASMAKLFASEMVNRVAGWALQMHGGYGFCSEYNIERHYRDARVFTIYEGTSEIQRVVISNNVLGPSRFR